MKRGLFNVGLTVLALAALHVEARRRMSLNSCQATSTHRTRSSARAPRARRRSSSREASTRCSRRSGRRRSTRSRRCSPAIPRPRTIPQVIYDLALAYEGLGDREKARARYREVVRRFPTIPTRAARSRVRCRSTPISRTGRRSARSASRSSRARRSRSRTRCSASARAGSPASARVTRRGASRDVERRSRSRRGDALRRDGSAAGRRGDAQVRAGRDPQGPVREDLAEPAAARTSC